MRRNDYVAFQFKYKGVEYRLFGDDFDPRNNLFLEIVEPNGSFKMIENAEIKEYGYKLLFDGSYNKSRFDLKKLEPYKVVIDNKKIKVTPDNAEEVYRRLIFKYHLPPLIFGYIEYPDIDAYRVYLRADGFKNIMYAASIDKKEEEKIYKYLYFLQSRFFYNRMMEDKLDLYVSQKERSFDIDEYNGARGRLKEYLESLVNSVDLYTEEAFKASVPIMAAKLPDNIDSYHAKEYILRLGYIEVKKIREQNTF